ncbi:MAG: YigZ family protein [Clostridia bacterium]|nr:YigZ family protein [Clostridia bacterium]
MEKYFSVERDAENEIVIERSRFITYVRYVETEEGARAFIEEIRKKHSLATHNCYAFVVNKGAIKRFSDDGEPSGTAGVPILDAIVQANLVDTCVVVTRYFGGVKLGAGGLVRAYSKSASEGIKVSGIVEHALSAIFKLKVSYDRFSKILSVIQNDYSKTLKTEYFEQVEITFACLKAYEKTVLENLSESLSGSVDIEKLGYEYVKLTDL